MNVETILVMETQLVATQLDLSCVRVMEGLLVMGLIVQVWMTDERGIYHTFCP